MSAPSLAPFIIKRPWLLKLCMPIANWYVNAAGYRRLGLLYVSHLPRPVPSRPPSLSISLPPPPPFTADLAYPLPAHRADDLIEEESEVVQKALGRLSLKQKYDRIYRIRRAIQADICHKELPRSEWTKPEEDVAYLAPLIKEIELANKEKKELDNIKIIKSR